MRAAAAERRDGKQLRVTVVPGGFVGGEARAVVRALRGGPALPPGHRTPPTADGVLVANVESLAQLAVLLRCGPHRFAETGTPDEPGTTLLTVGGAVGRPGVVEIPLGTPLGIVLAAAQSADPQAMVTATTAAGSPRRADPAVARRAVRFVYDGDNSTGGGSEGPEGSAEIETIFSSYFASQGLASAETPFNGRSDYGPFIANGVPAGGLFTGAEGIKTAEQAATYGGTAGVAYDVCYHQACDTRANISMRGLDQMSDAAAHAIYVLARSTNAVNGQATGHKAISGQAKLTGPGQVPLEGHRAMR